MRWDLLFADLESQAAALERAERDGEVDERVRIELARVRLGDRLAPALGRVLRITCRNGVSVTGALVRVGAQWLLVDEAAGRQALVALPAVTRIGGLPRYSATGDWLGPIDSRLGLGHVLRGIARDRSGVRVDLVDASSASGTIDRVGEDFLEVAVHDAGVARRASEVREVAVIALTALAVVRRDGG